MLTRAKNIGNNNNQSNNIDYRAILIDLGYDIANGNKPRCRAVYRGGKHHNSLLIDFDNNRYYDFGAEDGKNQGTLDDLIKLSNPDGVDFKKYTSDSPENNLIIKSNNISVVENKIYSDKSLSYLSSNNFDFYTKKGISFQTLKDFEAGFSSKETFAGRIVFPVRDFNNKIVGFNARMINWTPDCKYPKWLLSKNAKKDWVYNHRLAFNDIKKKNEVILVESIGDNLALYECGIKNVIVLFGKEIGVGVFKYLLSLNVNIIISTNKDGAENNFVGEKAAEKIKIQLNKFFTNVEIKLPVLNDHFETFEKLGSGELINWYISDYTKDLTVNQKRVDSNKSKDADFNQSIYEYYA